MKRKLFNVYKNNRGQLVPKAPVLINSEENREWIKTNVRTNDNIEVDEKDEWIYIGIGCSLAGNLYPYVRSCDNDFYKRYIQDNLSHFKMFDGLRSLKKYLNWVDKLPRSIVNRVNEKNNEN